VRGSETPTRSSVYSDNVGFVNRKSLHVRVTNFTLSQQLALVCQFEMRSQQRSWRDVSPIRPRSAQLRPRGCTSSRMPPVFWRRSRRLRCWSPRRWPKGSMRRLPIWRTSSASTPSGLASSQSGLPLAIYSNPCLRVMSGTSEIASRAARSSS